MELAHGGLDRGRLGRMLQDGRRAAPCAGACPFSRRARDEPWTRGATCPSISGTFGSDGPTVDVASPDVAGRHPTVEIPNRRRIAPAQVLAGKYDAPGRLHG